MDYKIVLVFVFIPCVVTTLDALRTRTLSVEINPGCPGNSSLCSQENTSVSLVHIVARGDEDEIHYWWTSIGPPTVLLIVTDIDTHFAVDWGKLLEKNISGALSPEYGSNTIYYFGVVLLKLYEFDDILDSGSLSGIDPSHVKTYEMDKFNWRRGQLDAVTNNSVSITFSANKYDGKNITSKRSGKFSITITVFGMRGREKVEPHLIHSANSSQFDFALDHLDFNNGYERSRFAFEVMALSSDAELHYYDFYDNFTETSVPENQGIVVHKHRSLDDEYSPGVFHIYFIETSALHNSSYQGGYIQWRPVCFTTKNRDIISSSTGVTYYHGSNFNNTSTLLSNTILYAYLGEFIDLYFAQGTNISFGIPEDGFYVATNYTAFTVLVGFGDPPEDEFSSSLVLFIFLGLGVPLFVLFLGVVFVVCRQCLRRNNDELLLNE